MTVGKKRMGLVTVWKQTQRNILGNGRQRLLQTLNAEPQWHVVACAAAVFVLSAPLHSTFCGLEGP